MKYFKIRLRRALRKEGVLPPNDAQPRLKAHKRIFWTEKTALISKNYFKFNFENISISKIICCRSRADRPVARHLHEVETEFGKLMSDGNFKKLFLICFENI